MFATSQFIELVITGARPTQNSSAQPEQGENHNDTLAQRTMATEWANEKRTSFVAVSENQEKVLIADSTRVNCVDLTTPTNETPKILTLWSQANIRSTSCAISGNGKRGVTTHYPARVKFWSTDKEESGILVENAIVLEESNIVQTLSWVNRAGTKAIIIFTAQDASYVYSVEIGTRTSMSVKCEKLLYQIRDLDVSENLNLVVLLESLNTTWNHRIIIQKLQDVGTSKIYSVFGFNSHRQASRICIANSTGSIFVQVGDEVRIFHTNSGFNGNTFYVGTGKPGLFTCGEQLCDVSDDGNRLLTCSNVMRFNVWYIPTRKSAVRCMGARNINFSPTLSAFGDVVLYVDHKNNLWKVSIETRLRNNLRNNACVATSSSDNTAISNWSYANVPSHNTLITSFAGFDSTFQGFGTNHQLLAGFESMSTAHHSNSNQNHGLNSDNGCALNDAEAVQTAEAALESIRQIVNSVRPQQRQCSRITALGSPQLAFIPKPTGLPWMQRQEIIRQLDKIQGLLRRNDQHFESHTCVICYESIRKGDNVICLPCDHLFHHDCTYDYLNNAENAKCPLCRSEVSKLFGLQHVTWVWQADESDATRKWSNSVGLSNSHNHGF